MNQMQTQAHQNSLHQFLSQNGDPTFTLGLHLILFVIYLMITVNGE
jgi:hypothetical protein